MNERLKQLRKALDLTQQEFSDRIGGKRNTVAKYETGVNSPSAAVISLICREFNVNEDWLRTGQGEMFREQTRDEQIASFIGSLQFDESDSFKKRFISALAALDVSDWEVLEKIAIMMHDKKD